MCPTPALIRGYYWELSILRIVQAYRFAWSLNDKLGPAKKNWPQAFDFPFSLCVCLWAKVPRLTRTYNASCPYYLFAFAIFEYRAGFGNKLILIPLFFCRFVGRTRSWVKVNFIFITHIGIITVGELKRYMADTHIFNIVIRKFYYKQKPFPIVPFLIDKSKQINFSYTILLLGLAVCL